MTSNLRHTPLLKRNFQERKKSFIAGKCISLSVKFIILLARPFDFGSLRAFKFSRLPKGEK